MNVIYSDEIKNALLGYLRIDIEDEADEELLRAEYTAAVHFCADYTGRDIEYIQSNPVFRPAVFCLVADMHDVRSYSVANDKINPVAAQILGMYSVNLL